MPSRVTTEYARVLSTPETEERGLAGRIGIFVGETRPSSSGVSVVGGTSHDYALALHFDELGEDFWFPRELLDMVNADGSPFVVPPRRDRSLEPRSPPDETPLTRFLGWLEQFLPRWG